MSSLSANLKLYLPFQKNRFVNYLYLIQFAFFLVFLFLPGIKFQMIEAVQLGLYPYAPMLPFFGSMFLIGFMVAVIQIDILVKPVSYCLPDHDKTSQRITFIIGIAATVFYFLLFIILPLPHTGIRYILYALFVSSTGLAFYFIAVFISYRMKQIKPNAQVKYIFFVFPFVYYFSYVFINLQTYRYTFIEFILSCFTPLCISTVLCILVVNKMLNDSTLKRKYCTKDQMTFFLTNPRYPADISAIKLTTEDINKESFLGQYLMKEMGRRLYLSINRTILGALYCMVARAGVASRDLKERILLLTMLTLITLIHILSGYQIIGSKTFSKLLPTIQYGTIFMLSMATSVYLMPVSHNISLPVGRSENFRANYLLCFIRPVPIMIWALLIVSFSWILNLFMPDLTIYGYDFTYNSLELYTIFMPLIFLPALDLGMSAMLGDIGYFKKSFSFLMRFIYFAAILLLYIFFLLIPFTSDRIISLAIMIIIANGVFVTLLASQWFKSDVV